MSGAYLAAIGENFENAAVTVDWFHVVQLFTKAVDEVQTTSSVSATMVPGRRSITICS
jgi:transposase